VGQVRGEGMIAALEFVQSKDKRKFFSPDKKIGPKVAETLLKNGVIGRAMPQGDILGFAPPLSLSVQEADYIIDSLRTTLDTLFN